MVYTDAGPGHTCLPQKCQATHTAPHLKWNGSACVSLLLGWEYYTKLVKAGGGAADTEARSKGPPWGVAPSRRLLPPCPSALIC